MIGYSSGVAHIRHAKTGEIFEVEDDELVFETVSSEERQMGPQVHHAAEIEHPTLGRLVWEIWEYPIGAENLKKTDVGEHELVKDLEYGLQHEPDDWDDYDVPDDPYRIFLDSYFHTGDLLAEYGSERGDHLLNRMVFAQQVTALEAYLGDTLTNAVLSDGAAIARLLASDAEVSKARFTLAEIVADQHLVSRKVREYLRGLLYHNLTKVDTIYRVSLGISILDYALDRGFLLKIIAQRHDCVHRNGVDVQGIKLTALTKEYVQAVADTIRDFVVKIEKAVRAAQ